MTKFYAQDAYENGFKEGIAHGQHLRDSERQSQSDRIKELEAELTQANERNKWIPVKEKPMPIGEYVWAGLFIHNTGTGGAWFEEKLVIVDDGVFEIDGDETGWDYTDYTHWMPRPLTPPKEGK